MSVLARVFLCAFLLLLLPAAAEAKPRCFGAAALDPERPACRNPALRLSVSPLPSEVGSVGSGPGRNSGLCLGGLRDSFEVGLICQLGVRPARARRHFALIGDSHSAHWRPAFHLMARKHGWSVISLVESGCAFAAPGNSFSACDRFRRAVLAFLESNPQIDTVFFSSLARGLSSEQVDRFLAGFSSLPGSVERIGVVQDNPRTFKGVDDCIEDALVSRIPPGPACSLERSKALVADSSVYAARLFEGASVGVFDFSDFFCRSRCYPVVGGALVYADGNHQTLAFNRSLAAYLERFVERRWPRLAGYP